MELIEENSRTHLNKRLEGTIPNEENILSLTVNSAINGTNFETKTNEEDLTPDIEDTVIEPVLIAIKDMDSSLNEEYNSKHNSQINIEKSCKKIRHKYIHLVKMNNILKNKPQVRNINKKLVSFHRNGRSNNPRQIKNKLGSDSILALKTKLVKKALARENVLEDRNYLNNSSNKVSIKSETSNNTLKLQNSSLSQNKDSQSTSNLSSVTEIKKENNLTEDDTMGFPKRDIKKQEEPPFLTGIVNVVLAQVNNTSILEHNKKATAIKSRENNLIRDSLTSAESYLTQSDTITSTSSYEITKLNNNNDFFMNSYENSSVTLTPFQNICDVNSDNDTFVIAKTSSYFKSNSKSDHTLVPKIETSLTKPLISNVENFNKQAVSSTLLDTVINMNMNPNVSERIYPKTYLENLNNVIVTSENYKLPTYKKFENDYKSVLNEDISKSTVKKSFDIEDNGDRRNQICLPSEDIVNELLRQSDKSEHKSCSEEFRNSTPVLDIWEKLTTYFDKALQKLENSLLEKISHELKQAIKSVEKSNPIENKSVENTKLNSTDTGLQCRLVQNQIIDKLAVKLITQGDTDFESYVNSSQKLNKRPEHILDIIKPAPHISNDTAIGYSVATSSSEGLKIKNFVKNKCRVRLISVPITFLKENILVIVSAPLFCFVLFLIYNFLVLVKTF